uniref:ERI1 exoribonuclease 2 n=1 Tax=Oryzias latipes TaxID=8090 RepID=A0A3P9J5F4_ORYLA
TSTKKLAKKLGLVRQRKKHVSASKKVISSEYQIFSYLIVIDFESTCWRDKNASSQEIIEFPAVLLNTSTGDIDSEFHTFVQPQEHPTLSEFCTELTGITQVQVEAGLPLQICLSRFTRWLHSLQLEMGFTFPNKQQGSSSSLSTQKLCTFLTWSDWDLGVCLQYECKRKQLHKPDVLNNWIDLRSTYRLWYNRKPKGLNGALQDLGLQFDGREHSGLDDARNTARLAAKMMRDGCVMKITRSLDRVSAHPMAAFTSSDAWNPSRHWVTGSATRLTNNTKEKLTVSKNETRPSTSKPLCAKLCQQQMFVKKKSESSVVAAGSDSLSVQKCESLISPKTLLNVPAAALWGHTHTPGTGARLSAPMNLHSTHNMSADDLENVELLVDLEERCGSYDDVVLECGGNEVDDDTEVLDVDTGIYDEEESDNSHSSRNCAIVEVKLKEGQKVTSPLCACGRRAKRQVVSNGGPNHGRGFYCCPVRRSGGKGKMEKRCEFFKWESALMQTSSGGASVFRSSVSFCQTNSSLSHYQPHRAQLRKSC